MRSQQNDGFAISAGLLLETWWTRGQSQLELAKIELGVSYELFVLRKQCGTGSFTNAGHPERAFESS